jgi:Protein of unknown function (DUF1553)/Protein of unknown function (DUF1549)/Planctomycete cytochrome C
VDSIHVELSSQVLMRLVLVIVTLFVCGNGLFAAMPESAASERFFEDKIRPLLINRCYECHSTESPKVKGGLKLDSREAVLKGGDSGPVIVPGNSEKSLLIKAVSYVDPELQMPPKHKLAPEEIALLQQWIGMGAPDPRTNNAITRVTSKPHWAFLPISDPAIPTVKNWRWVNNAIDYFVLAKLESNGLQPNFAAEKRTLIRRATFDLIGLPPTRSEIEAFVMDRSDDAFEKVIDRLLASPAYGERWGRHWLDLARYADTGGDSADYPIPQAYRYRNYVINAFNADKPYDQFIREQIAGDLLAASSERDRRQKIIATGYLALARRFGVDPQSTHHLTLEDTIDTMGRSILGLSLSCARCHDHKFDPIPTEDYYSLYGIFSSTRFPFPGSENRKRPEDLVALRPEQIEAELKPFTNRLARLEERIKKLTDEIEVLRREEMSTAQTWKALKEVTKERDELIEDPPDIDLAFAVSEGKPENAKVQKRGDPGMPGSEVARGFLRVLGGQKLPATEKGSGRIELADWLTSPTNPLTARVIVNRVWQHHLGRGLVTTASDFGMRGQPPSHPELLDHLARKFVQEGWSMKRLHKAIMLSSTYQQSSLDDGRYSEVDPANQWLWRFNRQRLDAEALRDSLLFLAGELDLSRGGPHAFPLEYHWNYTQHSPFTDVYDTRKRSVYLMQQRIKRHPYLTLFDGADPNSTAAERDSSATPLQALFAMNNEAFHQWAAAFSSRLPSDDEPAVQAAYWGALGRPARADELRDALAYLNAFGLKAPAKANESRRLARASLARALLASNEFIYVE